LGYGEQKKNAQLTKKKREVTETTRGNERSSLRSELVELGEGKSEEWWGKKKRRWS